MSEGFVTVNRETGVMSVDEANRPRFQQDLAAKSPLEKEARDSALKLSGLAVLAFEDTWKPDKALPTAVARHKLETEIEGVLATPEKAMKTAEYLQALQPQTAAREGKLWKYNSPDGKSGDWTYLPEVVFNVDDKGLQQICFGNKPFISKAGGSPYVAVCGDRLEK